MDLPTWLKRHALKHPAPHDPAQFTADVMRQVREHAAPQAAPARALWASWPRLALAAASVAVGILVTAVAVQQSGGRFAAHPAALRLAESSPADDASWMDDTLELLEQLDEEIPEAADDATQEDWLKELELLDDSTLASS
jgi:hypothetical protein